jgi:hypothetical protein
MSLFFAHSNPVTKSLIDALQQGLGMRQLQGDNVLDAFAILAGVAYNTIKKKS